MFFFQRQTLSNLEQFVVTVVRIVENGGQKAKIQTNTDFHEPLCLRKDASESE